MVEGRHVDRLQRTRGSAAPDGHAGASASPACATAPGGRRRRCTRRSASTRRSSSTSSTAGTTARSPGFTYHASHPGGRAVDTFPPTASRPRAGGRPASTPSAIRPVAIPPRLTCTIPSSRSRSTSGGERTGALFDPDRRLPGLALALRGSRRAPAATTSSSTRRAARARTGSRSSRSSGRWASRSSGAGGTRPGASSTSTASATTSTGIHDGRGAALEPLADPGRLRAGDLGLARRQASRSARGCSIVVLADIYGPQRLLAEGLLPPELLFGHPGFLRPCAGIVPAARPLLAALLGRRRARARRALRRPGRSPAGPVGRRLRAREPHRPVAVAARGVPRLRRAAPGGVLPDDAQPAARRRAARARQPARRASHAGALQRDLLRAGVPRAVPGAHARAGRGPGRPRRPGLPADARRPEEGRRHPAPRERRLLRSPRAPPGVVPRRAGPGRGGARGRGRPWSTRWGAASRRPRRSCPFLPAICRRLLGEDLAAPVGADVLVRRPEALSLRRVAPGRARRSSPRTRGPGGADLRARARRATRSTTCAPGSAPTRASTSRRSASISRSVPSLAGDELSPGRFWMRTYAVASGDGYKVMPGALSRVGGQAERFVLSLEPGGESKDTWVLARRPRAGAQPAAPAERARRALARRERPARAASPTTSSGWVATSSAPRGPRASCAPSPCASRTRTARATSDLATDVDPCFACSRRRRTCAGSSPWTAIARTRAVWPSDAERWLLGAVFDPEPGGTLRATLAETHRVARSLRDWLSPDSWRAVAHLDQELRRPYAASDPSTPRALVDLLNRVVTLLAALEGLITESMTHDQALALPRYRSQARARVARRRSAAQRLSGRVSRARGPCSRRSSRSPSSSTTYRRRYLATLQAAAGRRPLAVRRDQPALRALPARDARGSRGALPRTTRSAALARRRSSFSRRSPSYGWSTSTELCDVGRASESAVACSRSSTASARTCPALSNSLAAAYFNHAVFSA